MYLKCEKEDGNEYTVTVKTLYTSKEEFNELADKAFELLSFHDVEFSGDNRGNAYIHFTIRADDEDDYNSTVNIFLDALRLVGFKLID